MFGMTEKSGCPICGKEYETTPKSCDCGFDGMAYLPCFATDAVKAQYREREKELSFRIFKFAKQVYYGEKPYEKSKLVLFRREKHVDVDEALERRGLAYVDCVEHGADALPTVAAEGLLAMRNTVRALILNVNEAWSTFLDECGVQILLLGADFQRFREGGFQQYRSLRYIWVDGKNPYFTADDNVLFNKNKTKIVAYAGSRPGEEYTVPPSVKCLEPYSFYLPDHLKRLYLPRGIRIPDAALMPSNIYHYVDGELVKMTPSVEVIYYDPDK